MQLRKGLWLLHTRGRIEELNPLFDQYRAVHTSTQGLLIVSKSEYEKRSAEYKHVKLPAGWHTLLSPHEYTGDTYRWLTPMLLAAGLEWIGLLTDRNVPMTYRWDTTLVGLINGRNIVSCDDSLQAPRRQCGAVLFSTNLIRAVGYWYIPGIRHTYIDDVWEHIGMKCGCWEICMDVLVRKDSAFVTQQFDETHERSYGAQEQDGVHYRRWLEEDAPGAVARVKSFLTDAEKGGISRPMLVPSEARP